MPEVSIDSATARAYATDISQTSQNFSISEEVSFSEEVTAQGEC